MVCLIILGNISHFHSSLNIKIVDTGRGLQATTEIQVILRRKFVNWFIQWIPNWQAGELLISVPEQFLITEERLKQYVTKSKFER